MSLDGNGTYQPPAPQFPAIPNTVIYADDFNQIILDIATAISTAIFRDGQAAFTADQSMGGHKLTNLANGVNPQDATTVLQVFTDPVFVATTLQGFKITGSMFQALMTTIKMVATGTLTLTGTTLLDASSSGEVRLPSKTSIGAVSASELAVLNGLTATTAELNKLHGALLTTAELNILAGAVLTTAELNQLTGISANVQGQLDAKAPLASPAFTGIPTAPTATTGTSTNQLATCAFVAATAFNAALPGQAGNAGKFVTTDGVNAYWATVPLVGAGGAAATGSVVLTGASPAMQRITTTAYGQSVTLPDATTLQKGVPVFGIFNAGDYPLSVFDNGGNLLGFVDLQSQCVCSLSDNATANGVWSLDGAVPLGVSASGDLTASGTVSVIHKTAQCTIDANKVLLLCSYTTGTRGHLDAVVYDKSTGSFGSCTLVRSNNGNNAPTFDVARIDTARILVVSKSGNDPAAGEAVVLSISGTTISVGAPTTFTTTWGAISASLTAVGTSWVIGGGAGASTYYNAITVSGTTATVGAETSIGGTSSTMYLVPYDAGKVLYVGNGGSSTWTFRPILVSGTTVTFGTAATAGLIGLSNPIIRAVGSRFFVAVTDGTGAYGTLVTIAGTVASATAAQTLFNTFSSVGQWVCAEVFGNQMLAVCRSDSGANMVANVMTDNAGALVVGTAVDVGPGLDSITLNTAGYVTTNGTSVLIQHGYAYGARWIGISGNNPTLGAYVGIPFSYNPYGDKLDCSPFSSYGVGSLTGLQTRPFNHFQGALGAYSNSYQGPRKTSYTNGAFKLVGCTSDLFGGGNSVDFARESASSVWRIVRGSTTNKLSFTKMVGV